MTIEAWGHIHRVSVDGGRTWHEVRRMVVDEAVDVREHDLVRLHTVREAVRYCLGDGPLTTKELADRLTSMGIGKVSAAEVGIVLQAMKARGELTWYDARPVAAGFMWALAPAETGGER